MLLVKAELTVELLQEGWLSIPIRLGDCAIRSAQWNKEPARLISKDGSYHVLVERTGKAAERGTLSIEYTKAFVKAPNLNSVALQAPQAALNHWKIRIHEPGIKVNVHPKWPRKRTTPKRLRMRKKHWWKHM